MEVSQAWQPHHSFWASLAAQGLKIVRQLVKLNETESQAWDLVTGIVETL